jgi:predicted enzyme related to lactoylglutathione lyase
MIMETNRWVGVTIDCSDPHRLAGFWGTLLGLSVDEEPLPGWARVGRKDPGPEITLQPVPEPKQGKVRVHLDINVADIDRGIAQVIELGGSATGERHDYDEGVVVIMQDPEGNELCLVQYY